MRVRGTVIGNLSVVEKCDGYPVHGQRSTGRQLGTPRIILRQPAIAEFAAPIPTYHRGCAWRADPALFALPLLAESGVCWFAAGFSILEVVPCVHCIGKKRAAGCFPLDSIVIVATIRLMKKTPSVAWRPTITRAYRPRLNAQKNRINQIELSLDNSGTKPFASDKLPLEHTIVGDALHTLRRLPDRCIDLVILDPPYWKVVGELWDYKAH